MSSRPTEPQDSQNTALEETAPNHNALELSHKDVIYAGFMTKACAHGNGVIADDVADKGAVQVQLP